MPLPSRRQFINTLGSFSLLSVLPSFKKPEQLQNALTRVADRSPADLADDESFWQLVRQAYTVSPGIVNLNNGGVAPSPRVVQDAMKRYHDMSNEAPSYYMWRILDQGREPLRKKLASLAGVDPEEIALQRNASEALETVIFGLRLQKGDEVVLSKQDYPNMINAWKQRELRDGIKLVWVNLQLPSEDANYMADTYVNAFTSRTKVVHITHVINWNGQILPVKKIADASKQRGIEVLVDGAHSFAHMSFEISDLNCDYFGTSLHKWLSACIGTGFLYVRKEKIKDLFPLFAAPDPAVADIRKFENLGTRPFFIEQAITPAIDFYKMIGAERKQERLHYLKQYWTSQVKDVKGVKIGTPLNKDFSCAIAIVGVEGKKPQLLENYLFTNQKVHCVSIEWENITGVRVTPNVYTNTEDLDLLVQGIKDFAKSAF